MNLSMRSLPIIATLLIPAAAPLAEAATVFVRDIEPILQERCRDCHGPDKQKGEFRVDRRSTLLAGGDSGDPAIRPGDVSASYLLKLISGDDPALVMPPKGERVSAADIAKIKQWISEGAPTPASYGSAKAKVELTHWSLLPVDRSASGKSDAIDHFIRRKLNEAGLTRSPRASERKLIRRLYLVMHGLLPSPEQVDAFVNSSDPDRWKTLVDEVLASPRYGERWASHWLDLVRFGETHGFETNRERVNAWHYRDWVIDAFNSDKPYDQFVREQIAGDTMDADIGTGFLVGGPYDVVKGQDPMLRLIQRMNELDDMINTTGTAFLGLTLGCARCHNHKFDPVTQTDYYSLQAVFAGVKHADRKLPLPGGVRAKMSMLNGEINELRERLAKFVRVSNSALITIDDEDFGKSSGIEHLVKPAGKGYNPKGTKPGFADDTGNDKRSPNISGGTYTWWRNQPGKDLAVYRPNLRGRYRIWLSWGAGHKTHSTNAVYQLDADGDLGTTGDRQTLATVNQILFSDGTGGVVSKALWSGFLDGGEHDLKASAAVVLQGGENGTAVTTDILVLEPVNGDRSGPARPPVRTAVNAKHNVEHLTPIEAKFVRFTIGQSSQSQPCIDELEIFANGKNVALASRGAKATSSGDFKHPKHKLVHINDGKYGNSRSWISGQLKDGWVQIELPTRATIDRIEWARDREGKYGDRVAVKYRIEAAAKPGEWHLVASSRDRLPFGKSEKSPTAYDFASHSAQEAAQGRAWLARLQSVTKERDGLNRPKLVYAGTFSQPGPTHRLYRGEPDQRREEVSPGLVAALSPLQLDRNAPERERRTALADWIASRENPLTARVIVNRLWQFHFGEGIVDTPSDFGANGALPTHPELLDWLATELMDNGWSLNHLHRQILLSQTWQQDSRPNPAALKVDAAARRLWRFPARRLEAEGIRDAMLTVSGVLDLKMGGPGFSAFEVEMENVRHFHPKKSYGPEDWRRMIYMTKVRQERDSVFGAFDCPDASQVVPKRSRSTTPLQALNLLNSSFVMQQADQFAQRLEKEAGKSAGDQVELAYRLSFGRAPETAEKEDARQFIQSAGLKQFTRALLNANEFVFIP